MRFKLTLAALAATAAFASPAAAQVVSSTAQAEARGTVMQGFTLSRDQDLDFGTILGSTVAGSVTIDADDGSRSVAGGVAEVGINNGQRAIFLGSGPAGDSVDLTLSQPAGGLLYRDATTTLSGVLVLDQGGLTTRTIDGAGAYAVGVGGTFNIAANQPAGLYLADFNLTAEYQ
jgi:hypothetical protein